MALYNLARVVTTTTGTGTMTLGSAVAGHLSFANAGVPDGATVTYAIEDGTASEIGRGVYSTTGPTLTRSVLRSTNSNSPLNLTGSAQVFITAAAEDLLVNSGPGGRLSLTSGVPVLTATVSAATTVYYTPYVSQIVPLFDGTSWTVHDIGGELSQATTDTTKSPAACAANSIYDVFVWLDGSTYRATRGPAWSSLTVRGTGVGSTELELVQGRLVNKVAITNGPAAQRGTYVGTIWTNSVGTVDVVLGGNAAGGVAGYIGLWNLYNKVPITVQSGDTTDSWTYAANTWRPPNGASGMRHSFVVGLREAAIDAIYQTRALAGTGATMAGVGFNASNTNAAIPGLNAGGTDGFMLAMFRGLPTLGGNTVYAIEKSNAGTGLFYGDAGDPSQQNGFILTVTA